MMLNITSQDYGPDRLFTGCLYENKSEGSTWSFRERLRAVSKRRLELHHFEGASCPYAFWKLRVEWCVKLSSLLFIMPSYISDREVVQFFSTTRLTNFVLAAIRLIFATCRSLIARFIAVSLPSVSNSAPPRCDCNVTSSKLSCVGLLQESEGRPVSPGQRS